MPTFVKDDRALLFVHVPKTGGTTVESMLKDAGWSMGFWSRLQDEPKGQTRLRTCSPQHYHAALLRQVVRIARFDHIAVIVRHPEARFRSEFAWAHRNKPEVAGDEKTVEEWARRVTTNYAKDHFLRDNHIRPQAEFVLPGSAVFKFEDGLADVIAKMNANWDLGLAATVPHEKNSGTKGAISSRDVVLNDATRALVREFYAADFEAFGYEGDAP